MTDREPLQRIEWRAEAQFPNEPSTRVAEWVEIYSGGLMKIRWEDDGDIVWYPPAQAPMVME